MSDARLARLAAKRAGEAGLNYDILIVHPGNQRDFGWEWKYPTSNIGHRNS